MQIKRPIFSIFSVVTMVLVAGVASGQSTSTGSGQAYPTKPIHIVTSPAGSGVDFQTRLIAQGISGPLSQPVIVENRPSGVIPGETVAKAPPDGYTLLYAGGVFTTGSLLSKTPYDPVNDFSPITLSVSMPLVLVVHPSLPVKSVKELIALAKARPGELNYSATGTGGSSHLSVELFKVMTGVNIVRVPYSNSTQETADLIGGQIQLTISGPATLTPHIKSGKLRGLAVTSLQPSALFPELPTIAAAGAPGYESIQINGMYAPANTPTTIINRLNQEIVRVLNRAETKEKLLSTGQEVVGSSPDELAAKLKSEMIRWSKVIKDAGIRTE